MQLQSLVILDRDGVINADSPDYIKSPEEWKPIPGSLEAIGELNRAGIKVVVATNQSGIARGLYTREMLNAIHDTMHAALKAKGAHLDGLFFCPHAPLDACPCRKPKPGLLQQISTHFAIDLKAHHVPCIGDSLRDLEAAFAMDAQPILVLTGNGKKTAETLPSHLLNIPQFDTLASAIKVLLK